MADPVKTTIRLTDQDQAHIEKIIRAGAAKDTSESIRVALAEYARELSSVGGAITRVPIDKLIAAAAYDPTKFPSTRNEAERELLRRGYFPDGLGSWAKSEPFTTLNTPGYDKQAMHDAIVPPSGRLPKR